MTLTEHEKNEWNRLALSAREAGRDRVWITYLQPEWHHPRMPTRVYDELQEGYRAWLVSGWEAFDRTTIGLLLKFELHTAA